MAITNSVKLRVVELRADGLSYERIAKELSISKQSAVDIAKEKIDEVATLQAIRMEALFESERINTKGRIEQLSALHSKIREEIEKRDLSDVPTDKLINLFLKTTDALSGEVYTPTIRSTEEQKKDARDREQWTF